MRKKFERLRTNADSILPELGFKLMAEDKYSSLFRKGNGLKIKIVDQRYDPPECWISKNEIQQFTRIGFITEFYFDKELKLIRKHSKSDSGFDHGSIEYYLEFLGEYESQLLEMDDFVTTINEWAKNNYLEISEIPNSL